MQKFQFDDSFSDNTDVCKSALRQNKVDELVTFALKSQSEPRAPLRYFESNIKSFRDEEPLFQSQRIGAKILPTQEQIRANLERKFVFQSNFTTAIRPKSRFPTLDDARKFGARLSRTLVQILPKQAEAAVFRELRGLLEERFRKISGYFGVNMQQFIGQKSRSQRVYQFIQQEFLLNEQTYAISYNTKSHPVVINHNLLSLYRRVASTDADIQQVFCLLAAGLQQTEEEIDIILTQFVVSCMLNECRIGDFYDFTFLPLVKKDAAIIHEGLIVEFE